MAIDSFILVQNVIMSAVIGIIERHTSGSMLIFIWISYIIGSILKIVFYLGFHPWAELMRNDVKKVFKFRKNPTEQSPKWNICEGTNWLFNCFACKVECVRLWRIAMIYWHIEGICKWVNSEQIFFDTNYFELLMILSSSSKSLFPIFSAQTRLFLNEK